MAMPRVTAERITVPMMACWTNAKFAAKSVWGAGADGLFESLRCPPKS
jgi:hypothetical protein